MLPLSNTRSRVFGWLDENGAQNGGKIIMEHKMEVRQNSCYRFIF